MVSGPLRPWLGGTRMPMCSVLHPSSTWRHQDGFRSYSPGRLPAGWVRMDHGPEPEFCKIKAAERRDHIASLIVCGLFKEGWKIPNSALRKMEKEERILRNTQNVMRSSCRELVKCACNSIGFYLPNSSSYLCQIRISPSTLPLGGERDQEAENTCYSTGQKRTKILLSPPSLAMTYSKIAQNWGQAGISWLARWGKMCSGAVCYSKTWPCWPYTKWTAASSGEGYWGLLQFVPSASCELCISFLSALLVNLECRSSIFLSGSSSQ